MPPDLPTIEENQGNTFRCTNQQCRLYGTEIVIDSGFSCKWEDCAGKQEPRVIPFFSTALFRYLLLMVVGAAILAAGYFFYWKPLQQDRYFVEAANQIEYSISENKVTFSEQEIARMLEFEWLDAGQRQRLLSLRKEAEIQRQSWRGILEIQNPVPSWAEVRLNQASISPGAHELPLAKYDLVFAAIGYSQALKTVHLQENEQTIDVEPVELTRLSGTAEINSKPAGLEVRLKMVESEAGRLNEFAKSTYSTPAIAKDLPTGTYEVSWTVEGVTKQRSSLTIRANESTSLSADLRKADVEITSDPDGATIFADGKRLGDTPRTVVLAPGIHKFEAYYKNWPTKSFEITANPDDKVASYKVKWDYGSITFESDPIGAQVWVGTEELGFAPGSSIVQPGSTLFRATLPDLGEVLTKASVKPGSNGRVFFAFEYGGLDIISTPANASVITMTGKELGKTPLSINRRPGALRLKLSKPGYQPLVITESIKSGTDLKVTATLERE